MSGPLVLCYHAISSDWPAPLSVTPDAFERQIGSLVERGWATATFTEAVRRRPTPNTIVVTFDDAFASVKTHAAPVLAALGVKATVFAPTDYVTRQAPLAWSGLDQWAGGPHAGELAPMGWDDLCELAAIGWEIGAHSCSHPRLTSLDDGALAVELRQSRAECEAQVGTAVTSMAYPYGDLDARVMAQARLAGFQAAAALEWLPGRPDPYRYPRVGIYRGDAWPRFRLKTSRWAVSGVGSRLFAARQRVRGAV